jgi:pyruvate,water dikinase
MSDKWILWVDEFGKQDTEVVGGKCANLGEMKRIGIPVPPGFALTTKAYNDFLANTGAEKEIERYLSSFSKSPKSLAEYEELSLTISQIILSREMPKQLQETTCQAYEALCQRCGMGDAPVAVRSSGVFEDLATASFAGQYESYLNVRGNRELLAMVRRCWASVFSSRGISYRVRNGLGVSEGSISVMVQKMCNARCAGVGFTVDPNTGDVSRVVLEGNWGAGESVVQGIVMPDTFFVNKKTLEVEEKRVNRKLRQFVLKEQGTKEEDVPPEKQNLPCLSDEEAVKIADYALSVELYYGTPLDIEWVLDRELQFPKNIFLVQARPVTAIAKKKSPTEQILDMMSSRRSRRLQPRSQSK